MSEPARATALRELCLACGLCCNGGLFARVPLAPPEVERLRGRGLVVVSHDGEPALRQPCAAWSGAGCNCYAERPARCAAYECHLYARLAAGALDPPDAHARLGRILELVATLARAFGGVDGASAIRRAAALLAAAPPVAPEHAHLALDLAELVRLVTRELDARFAAPTRLDVEDPVPPGPEATPRPEELRR
ncbi:MAG: YkgJ family cysteine cluster protein [Polyangiaceae bacterium]|nr:YkgJ family cysteine cluster protein [Polyangiaceae bacterium]